MTVIAQLAGDGAVAHVTDEDALWLARMVVGEAGARAGNSAESKALVSTIVRRWWQLEVRHGRPRTLTQFARAFSTPIQPTPPRPERHLPLQAQSWLELPEDIRECVSSILTGRAPLTLPGSVNWGSPILYTRHGLDTASAATRAATAPAAIVSRETARGVREPRYEAVPGASPRGNVFHSTSWSRGAAEPRITATAQPDAQPLEALGVIAGDFKKAASGGVALVFVLAVGAALLAARVLA